MKNFATVSFIICQILFSNVFAKSNISNVVKLEIKNVISSKSNISLETRLFYKAGLVKLAYHSPKSQKVILRILNQNGSVLLSRKVIKNQISAVLCYDTHLLPKGVYQIETLAADEKNIDIFEIR